MVPKDVPNLYQVLFQNCTKGCTKMVPITVPNLYQGVNRRKRMDMFHALKTGIEPSLFVPNLCHKKSKPILFCGKLRNFLRYKKTHKRCGINVHELLDCFLSQSITFLKYRRSGSNRHVRNGHGILSPACLPIPPRRHNFIL